MIIDKTNWKPVRLGDITIKREENDKSSAASRFSRFLKVEHLDAESLHIKRWGKVGEDELPPTFYKIFRKGQILYPTRNPHLKRAALASFDGICGEKTLTLEPFTDLVDEKFYPFIFTAQTFYNHTTSSIIGSTNPHVRWRDIAEYQFLLPPKDQQAKMAELLWAADNVLQLNSKLFENLKYIIELKGSKQIVSNSTVKLSSIIKLRKGKKPLNTYEKAEHGSLPYLSTEYLREEKKTSYVIPEKENRILTCHENELLLLWDGSNAGDIFLSRKGVVSSTMALLEIFNKDFLKEYIYYNLLFNSNKIKAGNNGSAIPHVSKDVLFEFEIPKIKLEDQKIMINELQKLENVSSDLLKEMNKAFSIHRAILNLIFT